jgi:hypothetical protein
MYDIIINDDDDDDDDDDDESWVHLQWCNVSTNKISLVSCPITIFLKLSKKPIYDIESW